MASLYKRANERQRRILRIVEGAVKNVADHHPELSYSPRMARSIAKRAAGTLSAAWPEVLAGATPVSQPSPGQQVIPDGPPGSHSLAAQERGHGNTPLLPAPRGGAHPAMPHPNLVKLQKKTLNQIWAKVVVLVGDAKRSNQTERAKALIDVLKLIAAEIP